MSTFFDDKQDRLAEIRLPAAENNRSEGTEVPITAISCLATGERKLNLCS